MDQFLVIFQQALASISEQRFFQTERGYQGELLHQLQNRLEAAGFPGDPIVEQEYQKTLPSHGINIRPDLIIHIPFERGVAKRRNEGNFVAIEIKCRATGAEAERDFQSLELLKNNLGYPLTIFLNVDSTETHAERCPARLARQTVCFAVRLDEQTPVVSMERCG